MSYKVQSGTARSKASSLALVIGLHGAAIAAALLAKSGYIVVEPELIPRIINLDPIDEPPEAPPPEPDTEISPQRPAESVNPLISDPIFELPSPPPRNEYVAARPSPPAAPIPAPPPAPLPPVLIDARFAPGMPGRLQPRYPAALLRAGTEGEATVRVTIGADGRVKRVEKIRADHNAFFEATRAHALRAWRFVPATRDGRPVESSQVHTVRFEIRG